MLQTRHSFIYWKDKPLLLQEKIWGVYKSDTLLRITEKKWHLTGGYKTQMSGPKCQGKISPTKSHLRSGDSEKHKFTCENTCPLVPYFKHYINPVSLELLLLVDLPHRKRFLPVASHHLHRSEPNAMPSFNFDENPLVCERPHWKS